jgi:hypothetical protein
MLGVLISLIINFRSQHPVRRQTRHQVRHHPVNRRHAHRAVNGHRRANAPGSKLSRDRLP